jgi:hypothetical protein
MSGFTRTTTDGFEVHFWGTSVHGQYGRPGRIADFRYDFQHHAFAQPAVDHASKQAPTLRVGSVVVLLSHISVFQKFVLARDITEVNAESFLSFLHHLHEQVSANKSSVGGKSNLTFSEHRAVNTARTVLRVFKEGIDKVPGWSDVEFRRMRKALRRVFRGSYLRIKRRSIKRATPLATFTQLADAAVRELREAEQWLRQPGVIAGRHPRRRNDPYLLLTVALIGVLRYGIRAEEFNEINRADLERSPNGHHVLHLHAPNKEHRVVPVDDAFLHIIDLASTWMEPARKLDPATTDDALFVVRYASRVTSRYTTGNIKSQLPGFYAKWHRTRITSEDGSQRPVLHAPGNPEVPFYASYRALRRAYSVHKAKRLKGNIAVLQELLGHERIKTTLEHYTLLHEDDYADEVAYAMGPEAKLLAAGLKHRVLLGIDEDPSARAAAEDGRETPVGLCTTDRCTRSGSCLGCSFAVVLTSRRDNVLTTRNDALERAQRYVTHGDPRSAENLLRRAALAQATLDEIDRVTGAAA